MVGQDRETLGELADIPGRLTESWVTGVSAIWGSSGPGSVGTTSMLKWPLSLERPEPIVECEVRPNQTSLYGGSGLIREMDSGLAVFSIVQWSDKSGDREAGAKQGKKEGGVELRYRRGARGWFRQAQ